MSLDVKAEGGRVVRPGLAALFVCLFVYNLQNDAAVDKHLEILSISCVFQVSSIVFSNNLEAFAEREDLSVLLLLFECLDDLIEKSLKWMQWNNDFFSCSINLSLTFSNNGLNVASVAFTLLSYTTKETKKHSHIGSLESRNQCY